MASTAATNAPAAGPSAVRQSSRQTRTNPSRVSKTAGRISQNAPPSLSSSSRAQHQHQLHHHRHHHHHRRRLGGAATSTTGGGAGGGPSLLASAAHGGGVGPGAAATMTTTAGPTMPDDIYPGITHFTDTVAAIPREFRRHESLLKEVDGKSWVLEDKLPVLVGSAAEQVMRPPRMGVRPGEESTHPSRVTASQNEPSEIASRRQLLQNIRNTLSDLLPTIDEKNHVARNANKELKKQMQRLTTAYSFVQNEVSDEARLGSLTHWAYVNKTAGKATAAGSERPRRDATMPGDDARREVVGTRKQRRNNIDPDTEYSRARKGQAGAKAKGEVGSHDRGAVAATGSSAQGAAPKRRKVEKQPQQASTSAAMERSASTNTTTGRAKAKDTSANAADTAKQQKNRATNATTSTAQRKRTNPAASTTDSPPVPGPNVVSTTGNAAKAASPAQGASNRSQPSARAQPASNQPATNARQRPQSYTSGRAPKKTASDNKGPSKAPTGSKSGPGSVKNVAGNGGASLPSSRPLDSKLSNDEIGFYNDAHMANAEAMQAVDPATAFAAPSRARVSKTSTPATANTAESQTQQQRSRPLRSTEGGAGAPAKRSHKKGASNASAARQVAAPAPAPVPEDEDSSRHGDDEDDESEPRYCYCNQVSFGDMVACDNDNCPREWFHLSCVGLTKPPLKSVKWYCNECKDPKKSKSGNGR